VTLSFHLFLFSFFQFKGLLRLQQIYQGLNPGNETFQVEIVKRINNASEAIEFLQKIEQLNRWSRKYVVLDCPTDMAKEIVKSHVRDVSLGKRTYHYLLSGLVSFHFLIFLPLIHMSLKRRRKKFQMFVKRQNEAAWIFARRKKNLRRMIQ
jgi:hypothetical protein